MPGKCIDNVDCDEGFTCQVSYPHIFGHCMLNNIDDHVIKNIPWLNQTFKAQNWQMILACIVVILLTCIVTACITSFVFQYYFMEPNIKYEPLTIIQEVQDSEQQQITVQLSDKERPPKQSRR
mmetsp:Transcript_61237/g.75082  ORF Transcript_61237/g.75082 Transcript_61237/m.75082 type:complete len:123 (-) Transcript_61237:73-441(-)